MAEESHAVGDKEKVQILLAEYSSLRSETNNRISNMYQSAGWTAVVILFFLREPSSVSYGIGIFIAVVAIVYAARLLSFDLFNAARRVRELEIEINGRAGEKLLVWETERAGLNQSYWRAVFFMTGRRRPVFE